jgi:hypothetical protein
VYYVIHFPGIKRHEDDGRNSRGRHLFQVVVVEPSAVCTGAAMMESTGPGAQGDVWEEVVQKYEAAIKRWEQKYELQRKSLLEYKQEQEKHKFTLTDKNRRMREERAETFKQFAEDTARVGQLEEQNARLEAEVAALETREMLVAAQLSTALEKNEKYDILEKTVKELREELFYWEQHHSEHLQATLSAVLDQQDKVHAQFLDRACREREEETRSPVAAVAGAAPVVPEAFHKQQIAMLHQQLGGIKRLLAKQQQTSQEKIADLERKFLSAKQINIALERRLMQLSQVLEQKKV